VVLSPLAVCSVLSLFLNEGDRLLQGIGTIRNNAKGKDFARKGVVKAVKQPPRFVDGMNRREAEAAPGKTNPYVKYTEQTMDQRTVLASLHASSHDAGARRELDISVVPRRKGKDRGDFRKAPVLLTRPGAVLQHVAGVGVAKTCEWNHSLVVFMNWK
jgi:hypothetical protein